MSCQSAEHFTDRHGPNARLDNRIAGVADGEGVQADRHLRGCHTEPLGRRRRARAPVQGRSVVHRDARRHTATGDLREVFILSLLTANIQFMLAQKLQHILRLSHCWKSFN